MSPPLRLPRSQLVLAAARALCAFFVLAALPACKPARRFYRRHVAQAPAVSPARAQRVQRGREAYLRYCALCHANDGRGYRADHANAVANPDFLSVASDDFLRAAITDGHPGTPMSAWGRARGGPLDERTVDDIIGFLRSRSRQPRVRVDERRVTDGYGNRARGVWTERCAQCHGSAGEGTPRATSVAHPVFLRTASDGFLRHTIAHGRRGTPMPGFSSQLDARTIDDLVTLVRSFERDPAAVQQVTTPVGPPPPGLEQLVINPTGRPPAFTLREDRFVPAAQVARALAENRRMIILDARALSDWNLSHIPGALPFPFYDIEQMATRIPRDGTWILAYCACPHAASGHVVDELRRRNFTHTAVIDEGILHWMSQHYPTVRAPGTPDPAPATPSAPSAAGAR